MRSSLTFAVTVPVLVLALLVCAAAPAKDAAPAFKPGADVTLEITLKAPGGWKISPNPAVRLSFEKEQLKSAGFTVSKEQWEFKAAKYVKELTASIPIKVKQGQKDGALTIPLDIACSICDETGEHCSFANESLKLTLTVKSKPAPGEAQPQSKGQLAKEHKLSPPL